MIKLTFVLCEFELRYNPKVPAIQKPENQVRRGCAQTVFRAAGPYSVQIKAEAVVQILNSCKRVIGGNKMSSGGIAGNAVLSG